MPKQILSEILKCFNSVPWYGGREIKIETNLK
jgi:hypothetical protein